MGMSQLRNDQFKGFDRIPVGICVLKPDFKVIFWNRCLENWTKISSQDIFNQDIGQFYPHLKTPKYANPLQQIFAGGLPTIFSSQLHKSVIPAFFSNGEPRIQHTTVTAMPALEGEGFYAILVLQDVTDITQQSLAYRQMRDQALEEIQERKRIESALRESEERYAKIFQESPLGMGLVDFDHQFLQVNTALREMLDYSEAELINFSFLNLTHPEDTEQYRHYAQELFEQKRESFKIEQRYLKKNGEILWVRLTAALIHNQADKPLYGLFMLEDITDCKISEEALKEANQQLTGWINELEIRNNEITLLSEMSDVLQACFKVNQAHQALPQLIQPLFPEVAGGVFSLDPTENKMQIVATWGDFFGSELSFNPIDCWAIRRGRFHRVSHHHSSLRCRHLEVESTAAESLCVPMMTQGEIIGLLYLSSQQEGQFTKAKQQLAVTVAEHGALALANLQLRETLRDQSIRDSLTGLYNRRYLEETLAREIQRAERKRQSLGVMMIDIDYFKNFNDTYGHEAGDEVLRGLSEFIQGNIRRGDTACRYGGEELTLILPDATLRDTKKRAEELRQGVKGLEISYRNKTLPQISISVGIGCYPEHGESWTSLIRAADAALYEAKRQGRDRVIVANYQGES
jgi:diguanylate cyclase (GGDEF)-like protein/PAS domain S-box-containing protein